MRWEEGLGSTLYRAPSAFYLIPDDVAPAPGALQITALSGAHLQVDPSAVARFRVTESVARAYAKRAVTNVAGRLEHTVHAATRALDEMSGGLDGAAVPASAIEDLSQQLRDLVSSFQGADLTTPSGRAAVARQLANLERVADKAAAEATVARLHRGAGELLQAIDAAPPMDPDGAEGATE